MFRNSIPIERWKERKRDKEKLSIVKSIVIGQKYKRRGCKDRDEI
jgi:hypothetical protein